MSKATDLIEKVRKLRDNGLSNAKIRELTGLSSTKLSALIKNNNLPRRKSHRTPEIDQQVITMRQIGKNTETISKELNLGTQHIWAIVNEYDLPSLQACIKDKNIIPVIEQQIIDLRKQHKTNNEILQQLNITNWYLGTVIRKYSLQISKDTPRVRSAELDAKVITSRRGGKGLAEIANDLDISISIIYNILKENKLVNIGLPAIRKSPQIRICLECPEKGAQPIEDFHTYTNKDGKLVIARRCKQCYGPNRIKNRKAWYAKNKNNPMLRMRNAMSGRIAKAIESMGGSKAGKSCLNKLGYTQKQLYEHIKSLWEPWMNDTNYGKYNAMAWKDDDPSTHKWNVDHIVPHSDFSYSSMDDDDFKRCWALENLRPLSAKQNQYDGADRTRHTLPRKKAA